MADLRERIFITAGGSAHRLDVAAGIPKALMKLPDGRLVIERQLEMLPSNLDVTICTGYRQDLIDKLLPNYDKLLTYDVSNPMSILDCIRIVIDNYKDLHSYTFLLGDTIWHPDAMKEALEQRHKRPIVYYGQRRRSPCETYMMTISDKGVEMVREVLNRGAVFETRSLRAKRYSLVKRFSLQDGNIWKLDTWMDHDLDCNWKRNKLRTVKSAPVDDFDIDEQYRKIWSDYSHGVYDVSNVYDEGKYDEAKYDSEIYARQIQKPDSN